MGFRLAEPHDVRKPPTDRSSHLRQEFNYSS